MKIGNEIVSHTHELIMDPFGNYVLQYVLKLQNDSFTPQIIRMIKEKIVLYSKQKFSSNVIEIVFILSHCDDFLLFRV